MTDSLKYSRYGIKTGGLGGDKLLFGKTWFKPAAEWKPFVTIQEITSNQLGHWSWSPRHEGNL